MTMEILHGADQRPADDSPTICTVGMFDGVHRGHAALHQMVLDEAKASGCRAGVVTFDPHPLEVLAPPKSPCTLTTLDQRLALFEAAGFDVTLVLPFNDELAALTPEAFGKAALVEELHVSKVVVGEDFRFGNKRSGDVETLRELGQAHGFEVDAIGLVGEGGAKISSSTIRIQIAEGQVEEAAELLGHPFRLAGTVVGGDERGRELGFPTANLEPHPRACLPGDGVYAGWWVHGDERLPGAINVGTRPTFDDGERLCEIHLLDWSGDLYGVAGEVEFTAYLRPEERFAEVEELVAQMHRDVADTRTVLEI